MLSGDRTFPFLRRNRPLAVPGEGLRAVPAESRHLRRARLIVAAEPVINVHVGAMLPAPTGEQSRGVAHWAVLDGPRTIGVVQQHRGLCWAIESAVRTDGRLPALLAEVVARQVRFSEVLFGPESEVRAVVESCRPRGLDLVEIRRQEMMDCRTLVRAGAPAAREDFVLRVASRRDLRWLLEAHAAMCREDLGVDQVARNPDGYSRYFEELVRRRLIFVGEFDGRPVFKAEVALESRDAWLIEGVYTEPAARGRGHATCAMVWLTELALARGRISCLYVHRRNAAAIRLYQRIGYRTVVPWATAIVTRDGRRTVRAVEY